MNEGQDRGLAMTAHGVALAELAALLGVVAYSLVWGQG